MASTQFDHLDLKDAERKLIALASGGSDTVYLSRLQKGLSGANVWLARWKMPAAGRSKLHVLKIGKWKKVQGEYLQYQDRVSASVKADLPEHALFPGTAPGRDDDLGLLRQTYVGDDPTKPISLLTALSKCRKPAVMSSLVGNLFRKEMKSWYVVGGEKTTTTWENALDWWLRKLDLDRAVDEIGRRTLERSLSELLDIRLSQILKRLNSIRKSQESFRYSMIHGDLHSENVLLLGKEYRLIDFAWSDTRWTAIDFLMMECSIKFRVIPGPVQLSDLLYMEEQLDRAWGREKRLNLGRLPGAFYGERLTCAAIAVKTIRDLALGTAEVDVEQYRRGLALLTACLATLPHPINRIFVLHSLGFHMKRLSVSNQQ